jgi:leucyl-tRNA synthetase
MEQIASGWPQNVLKRQRDWIGRSDGAYVDFAVVDDGSALAGGGVKKGLRIRIFTTRIDTIYGANAVVVAAEHPVIVEHLSRFPDAVLEKIAQIRAEKLNPTDHEIEAAKDGIDTGLKAVNPFSGEELPVWIGNYVMMEYGTGAVMSVPAHDERDLDFAKKFGLAVKKVIEPAGAAPAAAADEPDAAFVDYGVLANSGEWSGLGSDDAKQKMAAFAADKGFGEAATTYRLRDWGISRQRFWGSPIPIVYCEKCGTVPERYENLPVRLPETAPFTGTGESPLAKVPDFYETKCPNCDGPAHRETDTMDTFVDSSWYFFRYTDPKNAEAPFDPEIAAYWTPVDQYVGGDDHAVMHLIYCRFWAKVMRDMGLVKFDEPIKRLLTQGMVVGETFFDDETGKRLYHTPDQVTVTRDAKGKITGAAALDGKALKYAIERMSKSKGNGVDPDEMVEIYGADAARLFVLFAAPVENELVWHESGIEGAVRFLQRVWRFVHKWSDKLSQRTTADGSVSDAGRTLQRTTHQIIQRIDHNLHSLQFNTPVAALMELSNALYDSKIEPETASDAEIAIVRDSLTSLIIMLTPFAPHAAEEMYSVVIGNENGLLANGARFPEFDGSLAKADEMEIAVQVNGKLRGRVFASPEAANGELESLALADEKVKEHTAGKQIVKVVVVPKRLVNIVVK